MHPGKLLSMSAVAAALLVLTAIASAKTLSAIRADAEATRLVTGSITIDPNGQIIGHEYSNAANLEPEISKWLDNRIVRWRFKPVIVDGTPRQVRANMSLRLTLKQVDAKRVNLAVASASFPLASDVVPNPEQTLRARRMDPPSFPKSAARRGVGGTAYVVVEVATDGNVAQAAVEQVNLRVVAREPDMRKFREQLSLAALTAARSWEFDPPTQGVEAGKRFWHIRVPVDFIAPGEVITKDDEWVPYIPGPRTAAPFVAHGSLPSADALASGGIYRLDQRSAELETTL